MNYPGTFLLGLSLLAFTAEAQKNYTFEEFLKAPDKELLRHKQELDMLRQQKKLNIPPSQAMLFYPDPIYNRKLLREELIAADEPFKWQLLPESKWLGPSQGVNKALDSAMNAENRENAQGHLVLYHSTQPSLYAKSYINTQLQKLALELKGKKINEEALLMRDLNKPRSYEEERSMRKEFLSNPNVLTRGDVPDILHDLEKIGIRVGGELAAGLKTTDIAPKNAEYLISTNLGITGNTTNPDTRGAESSLSYFLKRKNINKEAPLPLLAPQDNKLLDQTIRSDKQGLIDAYRDFNINTDTGILLQFIIKDENLARKILYNAKPGGFKNYLQLRGEQISDPVTILKMIRTDPAAFTAPNTFADTNKSNFFQTLNTQQMRLVVTGDKLLDLENPAMKEFDVKAYSAADKSLKEFQQKVDAEIQKIRSDYFAKKQQMSWPTRLKYAAIDLFNRRQSPWEQKLQYKRMVGGNIGSPFE